MISSYYYRGTFLQNVLSASQSNVLFVLHNCTFRFADHNYPGEDTIQEIYRLDRSLSLISRNPPEVDFIPIQPEEIIHDFQLSTATNEKSITYNIEGISSEGAEAKVNYVNGKISKIISLQITTN